MHFNALLTNNSAFKWLTYYMFIRVIFPLIHNVGTLELLLFVFMSMWNDGTYKSFASSSEADVYYK